MVWATQRFEELFTSPLRNGVSYPSRMRGTGVPMVNMKEIFAFDEIRDQDCELAPLSDSERDGYLLEVGDLLFARQSLTYEGAGRCVIVGPGASERTWESHIIRVRLDSRNSCPGFYFNYFRSSIGRRSIEAIIQQVAAAGIRGSDLRRLAVPVPPIAEQRAIAEVLGALDEKITANRKLEEVAEEYLATQFAALGMDSDADDRDARTLDLYFDLNPSYRVTELEPIYVDMQKLPTSGMTIAEWDRRPAKGGVRFANGDTLMARITPCLENRKTGYVDFLDSGQVAIGSTEYIVLRSKDGVPKELSYFLAVSPRFRTFAIRHMVGTSGRQRLSANDLAGYEVRAVDPVALDKWGAAAGPLVASLGCARDETRSLANIRDTLLPQLMSGKLRVRDAEKQVEQVL